MINTLDDYIADSLPARGTFCTNGNLTKKVDPRGSFLPYCGNTVVYLLDGAVRRDLRQLQDELYGVAGWMLADGLKEETFHMTVHDLLNGPAGTPMPDSNMVLVEQSVKAVLREKMPGEPICMRATWMFNMVNTSIVLGLRPQDDGAYQILDGLYTALEEVVPLGYDLTPHITLAYFYPGIYSQYDLNYLRQALRPVELEVLLWPENLVVQYFRDMNNYTTV